MTRSGESASFTVLADMSLEKYAFEAVVLRHPDRFWPQAVQRSGRRLSQRISPKGTTDA